RVRRERRGCVIRLTTESTEGTEQQGRDAFLVATSVTATAYPVKFSFPLFLSPVGPHKAEGRCGRTHACNASLVQAYAIVSILLCELRVLCGEYGFNALS